jgi:hypothetical protein
LYSEYFFVIWPTVENEGYFIRMNGFLSKLIED